jgi:hypothetical protein
MAGDRLSIWLVVVCYWLVAVCGFAEAGGVLEGVGKSTLFFCLSLIAAIALGGLTVFEFVPSAPPSTNLEQILRVRAVCFAIWGTVVICTIGLFSWRKDAPCAGARGTAASPRSFPTDDPKVEAELERFHTSIGGEDLQFGICRHLAKYDDLASPKG